MSHYSVVVIGAGQAGLAMSWYLTQDGVDHVVLERDAIACDWQHRRWDNFTLVTPNWQCDLPGFPYDRGDPHGFMTRDQVHQFVLDYAASFDPPVQTGTTVTGLTQSAGGGFEITVRRSGSADLLHADQVVVATGGYQKPLLPRMAERLSRSVFQLHSADYRGGRQLPDGAVLVVGSGQSGAQIAEDLHLEGRPVHLVTGSAPRCARFYRGRDCVAWLAEMGTYDVPIDAQAGGVAKRENTNHYMTGRGGGRDIDLRAFALEGMQLYGRLAAATGTSLTFEPTLERNLDHADSVAEGIKDLIDAYIEREGIDAPGEARYTPVWRPPSEPTSLDLTDAGITSVIWCVGFATDYSWLRAGVFDGEGHACHQRGVTSVPGLYFLGLPWLHTWGSGRFASVGRDAEYLHTQIMTAGQKSQAA
ncbi:MSMEG_0569 family flavin-dependent oxidoreductase [Mycolicibacterium mengxianglii]|uniref:MSMEG_0569 family flavin-dependent oxidoreductase n=1 Tax=Mycolicibacterium mengxianglii TaxID=2736649 RepID=UPI0022B61FAE|nr:MSMEG_0569 family flavin-dependent oxidoreductase [Mycolicibacterium mengxianglii]